MGLTNSTHTKYNIPKNKNYLISYTKQENLQPENLQEINIDLSNFVIIPVPRGSQNVYSLIYGALFYKLNAIGYSIKPIIPRHLNCHNLSLQDIINQIVSYGFLLSDYHEVLDDLIITPTCYYPVINTIKYLLQQNNILIGGILLDSDLINYLSPEYSLNIKYVFSSDIILIVGYSEQGFLIKTNWCEDTVLIDYSFIDNIKEVWNITLKPPIV